MAPRSIAKTIAKQNWVVGMWKKFFSSVYF